MRRPRRFCFHIGGHNLQAGPTKLISTGNGETIAFAHTTKFEIYHPLSFNRAYTMKETPIDFMPNLHVLLLGVDSFLANFILHVDYPRQVFSIASPRKVPAKKASRVKNKQ